MSNGIQSEMTNDLFMIECKNILLREYAIENVDPLYELTQQAEIMEFLPDWNAPREKRLYWMQNYEIVENKQFLQAVADGGQIGDLCLRLAIILKETGEFIGCCCSGIKEELPFPTERSCLRSPICIRTRDTRPKRLRELSPIFLRTWRCLTPSL